MLHQSYKTMIIMFAVILCVIPGVVFGFNYGLSATQYQTLESSFGNSTTTELDHNSSKAILEQTTQKTTYKIGENITVTRELVNSGNQSVTIYHWIPVMFTEAEYQNGSHAWPAYLDAFVLGGNPLRSEILKPNIPNPVNTLPVTFTLDSPGNYTITSMAWIKFDSNDAGNFKGTALWSKPLQITILPEKVPEFPLAILILLISISSMIVFYRMKFRK